VLLCRIETEERGGLLGIEDYCLGRSSAGTDERQGDLILIMERDAVRSRLLDYAIAQSIAYKAGRIMDVQLLHQVGAVGFSGIHCNTQQ
jgi:hypothetical protein